MKKLVLLITLTFAFTTSSFSQTKKICSKENQELVNGRFVPSDTLGAIPMTGKLIVSKKEIAIYSGKAKLFAVNPADLKTTYNDVGRAEFFCKRKNITIRIWDSTPISKGWIMIIKGNKATVYNTCN